MKPCIVRNEPLNSKTELEKIVNSKQRLSPIAKTILDYGKSLETRIVNSDLSGGGLAGSQINFDTGEIETDVAIDLDNIKTVLKYRKDRSDFYEETVIHEEIHRYTQSLFDLKNAAVDSGNWQETLKEIGLTESDIAFVEEVEELYSQYLDNKVYNSDFSQPDSDIKEFITYGLTNADFIKQLDKIKVDNKTILNKLIESIVKLFKGDVSLAKALDKSFKNFMKNESLIKESIVSKDFFKPKSIQVTAPNGKPSKAYEALYNKFGDEQTALRAYVNMYTPEFQSWFKDSVVVDANGEPKIVYLDKNNTDPDVFVLGENKVANIPMYISSKDPEINEDGTYNVYDVNEIQDAFNGYKENDYNFKLASPNIANTNNNAVLSNSKYGTILNYKRKLYFDLNERLKKIKNSLSILEKNLNDPAKANQYKNFTKFKIQTENLIEKTKNELIDLENNKEESILNEILDKDLERLDYLSGLKNITISEYFEATKIMDFFKTLIPRTGVSHPFYSEDAMFDKDGNNILDENILQYFEDLNAAVNKKESKIKKLRNELATFIVNNDASVKNMYDEKLKYEEIIKKDEGLDDATWIDKMFYDITANLFTNNGHTTEVMFNTLNLNQEQELKKAEEIHEKIDRILNKVIKTLKKEGFGLSYGAIRGVSFEMFKQKDEFGFETGSVVTKYSSKYEKESNIVKKLLGYQFSKARKIANPTARKNAFNKAADKSQNWHRENNIQVDIRKISEIFNDPQFAEFNEFFHRNDYKDHENELKQLLSPEEYSELIREQKSKLFTYLKQREIYEKFYPDKQFYEWDSTSNPFTANAYYYENIALDHETSSPTMAYNILIPRKNKASVVENLQTNKLEFKELNEDLGFYDKNYEKIENNKELKQFHDIMMDILKNIHEQLPLEHREKTKFNTIMAMDKAMTELLLESSSMFDSFSKVLKRLWHNFANAVTGKLVESVDVIKDPEVRADFINKNKREIANLIAVSKSELSSLLGIDINSFTKINTSTGVRKKDFDYYNNQIKIQTDILNNPNSSDVQKNMASANINKWKIAKNEILTYEKIARNPKALRALSELLGVDETIQDVKEKLNNKDGVLLDELIKSAATDEIMRQKSFDLPKVLKNYATLAAKFKAKNQSKPIVDILMDVYKGIKKPINDQDKDNPTAIDGFRKQANEQADSWYIRNILGDEGTKLKKAFLTKELDEDSKIKKHIELIQNLWRGWFPKYRTEQEKKFYNKLKTLLNDPNFKSGLSKEQIAEFEKMRDNVGNYFGPILFLDGLNSFTRILKLGYNALSMLNNRLEGELSNMIMVDLGYITKDSYNRAIQIARKSFVKNITFGAEKFAHPDAVKIKNLSEKLQKIQDSKNELQKSTHKSAFSRWSKYLNPFEGNTRVEYLNQSQLIAASLLDAKIQDKDGNESNVFDALNPDGTLKPQFKVGDIGFENQKNWELMQGDTFKQWSSKTEAMINLAHGNYHELRGMLIKQYTLGKSAMMFKSWMPMNLASKFAVEQESAILGKKKFKGRYRSWTAPTLGLTTVAYASIAGSFASVGALAMTSGVFGLVGFGLYNMARKFNYKKNGEIHEKNNLPKTELGFVKEALFYLKMVSLKSIGYPLDRVFGRSRKFLKFTDTYQGDFKDFISKEFTLEDAQNMNANATEAALTVQRLMLLTVIQGYVMSFWEWEEKKDRPYWYNFMINTLNNLNQNLLTVATKTAPSVLSPETWPVVKQGVDIGKFAINFANVVLLQPMWENEITAGPDKGGSYLGRSAAKLLPGTFKDVARTAAGDPPQVFSKTWTDSPFEKLFEKDWKEKRKQAEIERQVVLQERLDELEDRKAGGEKIIYFEEDVKKQVNKDIPLPKDPTRFLKKAYREFVVKKKDNVFNSEYPNVDFLEYLIMFQERYPNIDNETVVKYVANR